MVNTEIALQAGHYSKSAENHAEHAAPGTPRARDLRADKLSNRREHENEDTNNRLDYFKPHKLQISSV